MPQLGERITYIGIDPGASGGLVAICGSQVEAVKMPPTENDVWAWINLRSQPFGDRSFAVIEKVHAMPGNGVSGMFKFGGSYYSLKMALTAARIPYDEATPQAWQKAMGAGCKKKGESQSQWKNRLRARAQQLFPRLAISLDVADAVLIAEYCRRFRQGKL